MFGLLVGLGPGLFVGLLGGCGSSPCIPTAAHCNVVLIVCCADGTQADDARGCQCNAPTPCVGHGGIVTCQLTQPDGGSGNDGGLADGG
jgi:hypothetical protein